MSPEPSMIVLVAPSLVILSVMALVAIAVHWRETPPDYARMLRLGVFAALSSLAYLAISKSPEWETERRVITDPRVASTDAIHGVPFVPPFARTSDATDARRAPMPLDAGFSRILATL